MITINGNLMPEPTAGKLAVARVPVTKDMVNTRGETISEFVRYQRIITFGYRQISADDFETLANALLINGNALPVVEFYDPWTKQNRTGIFRVSPATASLIRRKALQDFSIELIER